MSRDQPEILIYSSSFCPYCIRVRRILKRKGVAYREIKVDFDPSRWVEMERRTRRRTVPQIFIGDLHVGGYDDLAALDRHGTLNGLLGITSE